MEWKDEHHLDYINTDRKGGFSFASVLIGDGNLKEGLTDTSVEESEQTTFGEHEGVYLKYHTVKEETHFNPADLPALPGRRTCRDSLYWKRCIQRRSI